MEITDDSQFPEETPFPPPGLASDHPQDGENWIDVDPEPPFGFQPVNAEAELEGDYPPDPIYPPGHEFASLEDQRLTDKTHYFHFDLSIPDQRRIAAIRIWHNLCCPPWKQLRQALLESKVPKVLYDELRHYVDVKDKARLSSRPPLLRTATIPVVREFNEVIELDLIDLRSKRNVNRCIALHMICIATRYSMLCALDVEKSPSTDLAIQTFHQHWVTPFGRPTFAKTDSGH